jgi:3-oxoacyl-[acyl-carrier protein] reductase
VSPASSNAPSLHGDIVRALSLHECVAVVTGAGSGIGRAAATVFAKAGANVVLADLDRTRLNEVHDEIGHTGSTSLPLPVDVRRPDQVASLAQRALTEFGRMDVWANVAGVMAEGEISSMPEHELRQVIDVNLFGTYWGCAAAARAMAVSGSGSIINVSSAAGDVGVPRQSGYAMTKAGVNSITRTLAVELGPAGVRVNCVAPGFTDTPMATRAARDSNGTIDAERWEALFRARAELSPLGLTGNPDDIAFCMLFLASDAARFITGQILRPNGGIFML